MAERLSAPMRDRLDALIAEVGHCPGVPQLIEAVSLGVRCCRHSLDSRWILAGIESLEQRTQRWFWNWWMEKSVIEDTVLP